MRTFDYCILVAFLVCYLRLAPFKPAYGSKIRFYCFGAHKIGQTLVSKTTVNPSILIKIPYADPFHRQI